MGQRYSDQELARSRAQAKRDEHAHARIDALQKQVAGLLAVCLHGPMVKGNAADDAAKIILESFKDADKQVEQKLGLR